jgi:hypothetical protein
VKHFDIITLIVLALACAGCVRRGFRTDTATSTGHGQSDRHHSEWSSVNETVTCRQVMNAQDGQTTEEAFALLRRTGLMPTERERATVPVQVRTRVQMEAFCASMEATAQNGGMSSEVAQATRAYCADRLGPQGISADTETSVEVEAEPPTAPIIDPRVQEMILPIAQERLFLGLFMADAVRYCRDQEASTPVFMNNGAAPGFAAAFPTGAIYGGRTFGSGGLGMSVFGRSVGIPTSGGYGSAGGMGGGPSAPGMTRDTQYWFVNMSQYLVRASVTPITFQVGGGNVAVVQRGRQAVPIARTAMYSIMVECVDPSTGATYARWNPTLDPRNSGLEMIVTDYECDHRSL